MRRIAVYALQDKNEPDLHLKLQFVPRSKRTVSIIKTSQIIRCNWITAVCSEIRTKQTNTLFQQNVQFLSVKSGGTYNNHWDLQG